MTHDADLLKELNPDRRLGERRHMTQRRKGCRRAVDRKHAHEVVSATDRVVAAIKATWKGCPFCEKRIEIAKKRGELRKRRALAALENNPSPSARVDAPSGSATKGDKP